MNPTALALAGFIAWFLVILFLLAGVRVTAGLRGKPANSFKPDGSDVSEFSVRVVRAHANCYESFPFIGGLLALSLAAQSTDITNPLALTLLAARVAQSSIHLASVSVLAVQIRFALFLVQIGIATYWTLAFLQKFAG